MTIYKLHIFGYNGNYARTEKFSDEESYGSAYAEYCGCGYRVCEVSGCVANVYPVSDCGSDDE